jgi:DNA-binding NarL/FixJ family response regulator
MFDSVIPSAEGRMTNGLELIEVVGDLHSSRRTVLKNLAVAAAKQLARRGTIASYEWREDRTFDRATFSIERGDERFLDACEEVNQRVPQEISRRQLYGAPGFFYPPRLDSWSGHISLAVKLGVLEIGALLCATGNSVALGVTVHGADVKHWPQARCDYWTAVAAHLGAAWRLRQKLATIEEHRVAELRPDGQLLYACGHADTAPAREVLRRAVLEREKQRTPRRSRDELRLWPELVAGRWSLVDTFTAGGTRHVVAYENPRDTTELRRLTQREQRILEHALSGRSGKWIALELGLSQPTVTRGLQQALRRLGIRSVAGIVVARDREFRTLESDIRIATSALSPHTLATLSDAERAILHDLLDGRTIRAIADRRGTSVRTVAHQVGSLYRKLGISSRRELVTGHSEP